MAETRKQRLLVQAAKLVGRPELARSLNVPEATLDAWIRGLAQMPDRKLLPLADLLDREAAKKADE